MSLLKPLLPKQHGAWAMLLVPFFLGIGLGEAVWLHLPLVIGWLFLYLATYPLLMAIKNKKRKLHIKWSIIYLVPALFALLIVLIADYRFIFFGMVMIPFFIINALYAKQNNERALLNDFSAISAFGIGGIASYFAGTGTLDFMAFAVWGLSILFFIGSTFFVKTMIREKRNPKYRIISWGYHASVIILLIVSGQSLVTIAFLPSLIRSIYLYGKSMSMMKIGILEIVNSAFFLIATLLVI
ncbi:YwiC-like family protein [Cytobacillus sp. S13-E01]|uniref:YwiC-like family protein n=1 Tax=Cytobacillus sp. S13-E01 TaxID=3031326 RepID=UPI0031F30FB2